MVNMCRIKNVGVERKFTIRTIEQFIYKFEVTTFNSYIMPKLKQNNFFFLGVICCNKYMKYIIYIYICIPDL